MSKKDKNAPLDGQTPQEQPGEVTEEYRQEDAGETFTVTREQMVSILWRWAGSPMLMDYPGLGNYTDAADISLYAQPALAWAHQKGLLPQEGTLSPHEPVAPEEAEAMLAALREAQ